MKREEERSGQAISIVVIKRGLHREPKARGQGIGEAKEMGERKEEHTVKGMRKRKERGKKKTIVMVHNL